MAAWVSGRRLATVHLIHSAQPSVGCSATLRRHRLDRVLRGVGDPRFLDPKEYARARGGADEGGTPRRGAAEQAGSGFAICNGAAQERRERSTVCSGGGSVGSRAAFRRSRDRPGG